LFFGDRRYTQFVI